MNNRIRRLAMPGNTALTAWSVWALLLGMGMLMLGNGLQGTVIGVRATAEGFATNTTGLIIEESAGCSLYANVNEAVLKGDFTKLPEDLMMCGVAMSLTDTADLDNFSFDDDELS